MFYTIIKCVHFKLPTIFHSPGVARCGAKGNVNWSNCGKWVPSCLLFICVCMSCVADYCDRNMQQRNSNSGDGEYFTFGFAKTHGRLFYAVCFLISAHSGDGWMVVSTLACVHSHVLVTKVCYYSILRYTLMIVFNRDLSHLYSLSSPWMVGCRLIIIIPMSLELWVNIRRSRRRRFGRQQLHNCANCASIERKHFL